MFQKIALFQNAHAMARHAGTRQAIAARNLAHADTPGYRALDLPEFRRTMETGTLTRARPGHLGGPAAAWQPRPDADAPADPNGNTVSLEREMLRAVDIQRQHDRALAIYKTGLSLLRTSLGRR